MTDVTNAYNEVLAGVRGHFHGIEAEAKNLVAVDLSLMEEENPTPGIVKYEVTSMVNIQAAMQKSTTSLTFGSNDYWYYGQRNTPNGGYCDGPYSGQNQWSDAAYEIQKKIHNRKAVPTKRYWYSNNVTIPVYATDYLNHTDNQTNDNYREWLMYGNMTTQDNGFTCIPPAEMNFHLWGTEYVIYHYNNETNPGCRPVEKDFISIDLRGIEDSFITIFCLHEADIKYGILQYGPNPADIL